MKGFIEKGNESEAQGRRRNDLAYVGGFTAKEVKEYIIKRYQEDQKKVLDVSESTVQRFFTAPNKNFLSSHYYKEIVQVKQLKGDFSFFFFVNCV